MNKALGIVIILELGVMIVIGTSILDRMDDDRKKLNIKLWEFRKDLVKALMENDKLKRELELKYNEA